MLELTNIGVVCLSERYTLDGLDPKILVVSKLNESCDYIEDHKEKPGLNPVFLFT